MGKDRTENEEFEPGAPSEGFLDSIPDELTEPEDTAEPAAQQEEPIPEQPDAAEERSFEDPYADEDETLDSFVENEILQAEKEDSAEEQLKKLGEPPVVPDELTGWRSLLHTLFSWFDDEFTEREQKLRELKEYNEKKDDLEHQIRMEKLEKDPDAKARAQWRDARNAEYTEAVVDDEKLQKTAQAYAQRIGQNLDGIYSETEKNFKGILSRNRLISIEGTCLETLLNEEYEKIPTEKRPLGRNGQPMLQQEYAATFGKNLGNEMVAAALLSGRRVSYLTADPKTGLVAPDEMRYLPKADPKDFPGMSPAEFDRLTQYAHQKEPISLTETQRHQRDVRNADLLKKVNYFDTMELNSVFSRPVKDSFFSGWENEPGKPPRKAAEIDTDAVTSKTRGGLSSLCVACMLCKEDGKYTIEDVLDPTKLLKEKDEIGREVLQHLQDNDFAWVARMNLAGREIMGNDLSRRTNQTDFNDPSSLYTESNRMAYQESLIMFDLSQDYNMNTDVKQAGEAWFSAHGKTEEERTAFLNDFDSKTMYYPTLFSSVYEEKKNYSLCAAGLGDLYSWNNGIGGTFSRALITERRKADPDAPIHSLFKLNDVMIPSSSNLLQSTSKTARRELFSDRSMNALREKSDKMETGEYWKKFDISFQPGDSPMPQMKPHQKAEKELAVPIKELTAK